LTGGEVKTWTFAVDSIRRLFGIKRGHFIDYTQRIAIGIADAVLLLGRRGTAGVY